MTRLLSFHLSNQMWWDVVPLVTTLFLWSGQTKTRLIVQVLPGLKSGEGDLSLHLVLLPWVCSWLLPTGGFLYNTKGVDAKLDVVNDIFAYAQDTFCPMEEFKVRLNGGYLVSAKLARLSKMKAKEFKKNGYSKRFKELKKE